MMVIFSARAGAETIIPNAIRGPLSRTMVHLAGDGWGGWIRTIIMGFKVPCPAFRRRPSRARACMGAARGSSDDARGGGALRMTDGQRARGMAEWPRDGGGGRAGGGRGGVRAAADGGADPVQHPDRAAAAGAAAGRVRGLQRGARRHRAERERRQRRHRGADARRGGAVAALGPGADRRARLARAHLERLSRPRGDAARDRAPARAGVRAEPPPRRLPPLRAAPRRPGNRLRRRAAAGSRREPPLHPGAAPGRAARPLGEQADPFPVAREPRAPWQAGPRRRHSGRPRPRAAFPRGQAGPLLPARTGLPHPADAVQPVPPMGGAVTLLLHRLRRDENGQVLVLGAIFGLVLMLCVLSTVNLGRAVYAKVQLQTAADAAAYSQAAVEARVLNFTAYTNRAMVAHYASIMAAAAYLTWVHFLWAAIDPVLSVLRNVPYAGPAFEALREVFRGLLVLLDSAVALMTPLVSAANVVLYTLQEGAWLAVGAPGGGRLSRLPPEAHSGDSAAAPVEEIWPALVHAANQTVFARTRGKPLLVEDVADSGKILLNGKDDAVQISRAMPPGRWGAPSSAGTSDSRSSREPSWEDRLPRAAHPRRSPSRKRRSTPASACN